MTRVDVALTYMNNLPIRRHARDVYFRNVPNKNGVSYLNVLACFSKTSQMAVAKNN